MHKEYKHTRIENQCDQCNFIMKCIDKLKIHIQRKHELTNNWTHLHLLVNMKTEKLLKSAMRDSTQIHYFETLGKMPVLPPLNPIQKLLRFNSSQADFSITVCVCSPNTSCPWLGRSVVCLEYWWSVDGPAAIAPDTILGKMLGLK